MTTVRYRNYSSRLLFAGIWTACFVASTPSKAQVAADLTDARPEEVGFSSERLKRLDSVMQGMVDGKEFAGIVTMAARHGKVFQSKAYGLRDVASESPMEKDAIFRIYSMSKPITGVAMMILYEEGKWSPEEPIAKYIPEFANLKVFKGVDAEGKMLLEDPDHQPTMRELMSHTAGFSYGFGNEPVDKLYQDGKGNNMVLEAPSLQEMILRLSKIPLLYQPGTRFAYSASVDIQGYLVQKLSGMPFPVFLKKRIFDPLGMMDTGFSVPKEKWNRFATCYERDEKGELIANPDFGGLPADFSKEPDLPSGGGGMVSTASDYLRFAQALLNGGQLNGMRILGPETVKMMSANQLPETLVASDWKVSEKLLSHGWGFGFDFAVFENPALVERPCGKGTYFWAGAAGTWFWIDPTNDVVFVGMVQRKGTPLKVLMGGIAQQVTYQALVDIKK
jgi:CubicO group peptidase (beta-lactamase class C family)